MVPEIPTLKSLSIPTVPSTSKFPSIWVLPVVAITLNLLVPDIPTLKLPSTPNVLFNSVVPWITAFVEISTEPLRSKLPSILVALRVVAPSALSVPSTSKLFSTVRLLLNVALVLLPVKKVWLAPDFNTSCDPAFVNLPNSVPASLSIISLSFASRIISPDESIVNVPDVTSNAFDPAVIS